MQECLTYFERSFLNMYPLKVLKDLDVMIRKCQQLDDDWQKFLIERTVRHPLNMKFEIDRKYQQAFVKYIIFRLEKEGIDVSDELYDIFCSLLTDQDKEGNAVFKHYILDDSSSTCITLKESKSIISQGTTGLCSWQAAHALADWCINHADELHGKNVLEIGCGVGLTGIATVLCCNPQSYIFSDCHSVVLETLCENVCINLSAEEEKLCYSDTEKNKTLENVDRHNMLKIRYRNADVQVMNLPWAEITKDTTPNIDFVLAADVVYDKSTFSELCQALKNLLYKRQAVAIIACTVRDQSTLNDFLILLAQLDLRAVEDVPPKVSKFLLSPNIPVKIYKIQDLKISSFS